MSQNAAQDIYQKRPQLFRPGQTGNPGGKQRGQKYNETYAGLVAELHAAGLVDGRLTTSQKVILDRVADGKCTAATLARLLARCRRQHAKRRDARGRQAPFALSRNLARASAPMTAKVPARS
jgi:hypothetical protein